MAEPATREDMRRHPNDPLKGIAFVDELPNGKLTTQPIGKHVATIDLEVWFSHLLQHGEAEVCPGWKVKLERGTGLEAVELLADHLQFGGDARREISERENMNVNAQAVLAAWWECPKCGAQNTTPHDSVDTTCEQCHEPIRVVRITYGNGATVEREIKAVIL